MNKDSLTVSSTLSLSSAEYHDFVGILQLLETQNFTVCLQAFISPLSLSATACSLICLREKVVRKQEKNDTLLCCGLAYILGRAALCSFSQPSTWTTNIYFKSEIICISTISDSDSLTNTLCHCVHVWFIPQELNEQRTSKISASLQRKIAIFL